MFKLFYLVKNTIFILTKPHNIYLFLDKKIVQKFELWVAQNSPKGVIWNFGIRCGGICVYTVDGEELCLR